MAYRQKAPKRDIRDLPIGKLSKINQPAAKNGEAASTTSDSSVALSHDPKTELMRILLSVAPLVVLLLVGTYYEYTRHWVIPFANWLMQLGS